MSESLHLEPPPYERFQVPLLTPHLRSNSALIPIMLATWCPQGSPSKHWHKPWFSLHPRPLPSLALNRAED